MTFGRFASGQEKDHSLSVDDPKSPRAVVASVGPIKITAEQFRLSFEFGPAFAKRSKDAKQRYLSYMINEKLLGLDAMSRKDDIYPRILPTLEEIEGDIATEELFKEDVQSKVKVTGPEIATGIAQSKRQMTLQWIFAPTQEEINHKSRMLRSGVAFDSLFRLQGPDSMLSVNRELSSTLFSLRTKNPKIARVADTLKPFRASAPLRGEDGWYILRIRDETRDMLTTQSDEMKMQNDVYRALLQQKSDSVSDLYVNSMMTKHHPVIVPETFDLLSSYLALFFLDSAKSHAWSLVSPVGGGKDSATLAGIDKQDDSPLVNLSGGVRIPLKRFLVWYRTRETLVKLSTVSKHAYLISLEQMVWQMVRDYLLVERAFKRNLQSRESVVSQKKWWEEKLLFDEEKRSIADSISFNDHVLQAYFEDNRRQYKDPKGGNETFSDAREDVLRDYYEYEVTKRILHRLNVLKNKYPVRVDEKVLDRIPVQGDPKTIDLYAVKKGGTFPRPAFPVIDMMWQTWQ